MQSTIFWMGMQMEVLFHLNSTLFSWKFTFFLVADLVFQKPKVNSKNENWENWWYKAL